MTSAHGHLLLLAAQTGFAGEWQTSLVLCLSDLRNILTLTRPALVTLALHEKPGFFSVFKIGRTSQPGVWGRDVTVPLFTKRKTWTEAQLSNSGRAGNHPRAMSIQTRSGGRGRLRPLVTADRLVPRSTQYNQHTLFDCVLPEQEWNLTVWESKLEY